MYRTTTDFASIGAGVNPRGFNVNTIQPFQDSLNPTVSHSLDNFLSNNDRAQTNSLHEATGDVFDAGVEMAELHNRIEDRLREAREGVAEETKGGLTADETQFLQGIEDDIRRAEESSNNDFERQQNVSEFINSLDPEDRILDEIDLSDDIRDHRAVSDRLNESMEVVNEAGELHARAGGGLVGALHPTNIAGGLVGGLMGSYVADRLDEKGAEKNTRAHQALSGALGGVGAEGIAAGLGGTLTGVGLGAAGVGGAIGLVSGTATEEAVGKALEDTDLTRTEKGFTKSSVAGAVGGGTAGLTTTGLGIAATALTAEEGIAAASLAAAPETLGTSLVVGALLGSAVAAGAYATERYEPQITKAVETVESGVKTVSDVGKDVSAIKKGAETIVSTGVSNIEKTGQEISKVGKTFGKALGKIF
jgi:hypothetical protein